MTVGSTVHVVVIAQGRRFTFIDVSAEHAVEANNVTNDTARVFFLSSKGYTAVVEPSVAQPVNPLSSNAPLA